MMYDDTDLEDSSEDIAEWVKENAASAASRWASIVPGLGLESCKGTLDTLDDVCPQNSDGSVVKIVIGLCLDKGSPACYSVGWEYRTRAGRRDQDNLPRQSAGGGVD